MLRWAALAAWAGCALVVSDIFLPLGRDEVVWRGLRAGSGQMPWTCRVKDSLHGLGAVLCPRLPERLKGRLRLTCGRLGPFSAVEEWIGATAAAGVAGAGWLLVGGGPAGGVMSLLLRTACGGLLGATLVLTALHAKAAERQARLVRDLPALVDLLLLGLEGGLSLGGALSEAAGRLEGPLRTELRVAEERVRLGLPRQQALADVAGRLGLRDLTTLVTLLNQAETLGTGVTKAVEAIARRLRTGRVLAAERRAGEAPVKMLFPLIFCLFPSILVLLVGPVLLGRGALFSW